MSSCNDQSKPFSSLNMDPKSDNFIYKGAGKSKKYDVPTATTGCENICQICVEYCNSSNIDRRCNDEQTLLNRLSVIPGFTGEVLNVETCVRAAEIMGYPIQMRVIVGQQELLRVAWNAEELSQYYNLFNATFDGNYFSMEKYHQKAFDLIFTCSDVNKPENANVYYDSVHKVDGTNERGSDDIFIALAAGLIFQNAVGSKGLFNSYYQLVYKNFDFVNSSGEKVEVRTCRMNKELSETTVLIGDITYKVIGQVRGGEASVYVNNEKQMITIMNMDPMHFTLKSYQTSYTFNMLPKKLVHQIHFLGNQIDLTRNIISPMDGYVRKLFVTEGCQVSAGQKLAVVLVQGMYIVAYSPTSGFIKGLEKNVNDFLCEDKVFMRIVDVEDARQQHSDVQQNQRHYKWV